MPSEREATGALRCSFCGKSQDEVERLIAGPAVYICNECVSVCDEVLANGDPKQPPETYVGAFTCPKCKNTFVLHFQQIRGPEP